MNVSTVSSKYQIVIPRAIRQKLKIKPGQRVYLGSIKAGEIVVKTTSQVDKLYGSMAGAWDKDGDEHLKTLRNEATHDRT